ncbi:MAG: hypothetical protein WD804_01350 [Gemmatimonadota bacterium]
MTARSHNVFAVDPKDPRVPEALRQPPLDHGEVVLLLADEGARAMGWSGKFAVALAGGWADAGHRVLLADAILDEPTLHARLGLGNAEGVVDLIHYGASRRRIARSVAGAAFRFASGGTPVADASDSYRSPRWTSLAGLLQSPGEVVLLYLAAEAPGIEELTSSGNRVFRLTTDPGKAPTEGEAIIIVAGAVDATKPAPSAKRAGEAAAPPDKIESLPAIPPAPLRESPPAEKAVREARTPIARGKPGIVSRAPAKSESKIPISIWLLVVLLIAVVLLVITARMGLVEIPGLTPASLSLLGTLFLPSVSGPPPE